MTGLKWAIPLFAIFMLIFTGWVQPVRSEGPIIPWIYFSSQISGDDELYRMHPDGTAQQRLSFAEGRERYLFINEEWIYFYRDNVLYRMHPDGSQPEPILSDYSWVETVSPDGQWIYFMVTQEGAHALYRIRANGTDQTRLTPLDRAIWFQTFDENNEWLYYTLQEGNEYDSWALYRMHPDGSQSHKLVDIAGYDEFHGFSPDNQWLYFMARGEQDTIFRMNLADFKTERLTPDSFYDHNLLYMREHNKKFKFSPDDSWLYTTTYSGTFDIYRMHLDGTRREKLTDFQARENNWLPWLSYQGDWLYFAKEISDIRQLFGMHPDGTDLRQLSDSHSINVELPRFSLDGKWLYYSDVDIYRMHLDGSQHQNLTSTLGMVFFWTFSPNGQWIYFESWQTGYRHLYRMHLDGTNVEQLTPTYNGNDYWGMFGAPVDLPVNPKMLQAIAFGLLSAYGLLLFGCRHLHHIIQSDIRH